MFDRLDVALREAEAAMADIDPKLLIGTQPSVGVDLLIRHERVTAAARLAMVARAEEMHPWQREGFRCFEDWLATREGTSHGQARKKARTARKLRDRDKTAEALADGQISEDEADVIADAADQNPTAERELLDTAKNKNRSHKDLQDRAADAKAAGESDRDRADRFRRGRRGGWGVDREGFWTLSGRFEPQVGAEMKARLAAEVDHVFNQARQEGTREPGDRYRADAIANLIRGRQHADTPGRPMSRNGAPGDATTRRPDPDDPVHGLRLPEPSTPSPSPTPAPTSPASHAPNSVLAPKELVLVIDLATLRRGCVRPGESCRIRGVGPVPVEVARTWVDDAFVKAVIRDGDDIRRVHHFGRTINARLRTALDLVEPVCAVPRCDNPRLEYHHLDRHADLGPTSWWNLGRPCTDCHHQATHDGYRLAGTPGNRLWINPDGIVERADDPTLVGRPPPTGTDPPPTGRQPDDDADIDLTDIDTIEAFDQLADRTRPSPLTG